MKVDLIDLVTEMSNMKTVLKKTKKIIIHLSFFAGFIALRIFYFHIKTMQHNSHHNQSPCLKGFLLFPRRDKLVFHVEYFMLYKFTAFISEEFAAIVI